MAIAVYTSDLVDIFTDGTTTGWSALGGGASGLNQETDYFIQGTSCLTKNAWASALKGMIYAGGSITVPTDGAIMLWITHQTANSLNTLALGGLRVIVGSSSSDYNHYYIGGNDTIKYDDRWICTPINPTIGVNTTTGTPTATRSFFGGLADMVGGPTKGSPFAIDAIRYGRVKYSYTNGDISNGYANFDGAATFNDNVTRAYGQIQLSGKVYKIQGLHELGTTATPVDFRDSNRNLVIRNTLKVTSGFNAFTVNNASSNILWTNINISALGSISRGNFTVVANAIINLDTCTFVDMGLFVFQSNSTSIDTTYRRTKQITLGGGALTRCLITNNIDTSSVLAATTNRITGCTFQSDGSNHAVQLNSLGTGSMDWKNNLVGYATSNGATGNEAIFVNVASGTLTINVFAGYSTPSIRTAGAVVTLVIAPVTTTITVSDINSGAFVNGARVLVEAFSGGSENYRKLVTSITNVTTTATVTHSNHGLLTGAKVRILGANQVEYNGVKTITVTGVNTYTFTTSGGPTSPATGTITSTTVFIDGVTNSSGVIVDTRSFTASQPIKGRVRRATNGILYKTSPISAIISNVSGLSLNVQMIPDE